MSKKSRLIPCKHCGNSNSVNAKTSPHSNGKNKKIFDIKRWFWVITVIILIGIFSGCTSMDSSSTTKGTTPKVASESTKSLSIKESTPVAAEKEIEPTPTVEETKPKDDVSTEYKNALRKAETYSDMMHMSKQGIYNQLTSDYGEKFHADAAQYAVDNIMADWNTNALAKAKEYSDLMHMSKQGLYAQLTSDHGEKFTADEAQYAVDNVDVDWNANALEKAKEYQDLMSMSKAAIYDQLTSAYGEKFTADEAQYAIDHLE